MTSDNSPVQPSQSDQSAQKGQSSRSDEPVDASHQEDHVRSSADGQPHEPHSHEHHHEHGNHEHQHDAEGNHIGNWAETLPPPSGSGTVMLDIGEGVGGAVVVTPEEMDLKEIEIRAESDPWAGRHVAVRSRPLPSGTMYAAMFEGLQVGAYVVRERFGPEDGPELSFVVESGRVCSARWPTMQ